MSVKRIKHNVGSQVYHLWANQAYAKYGSASNWGQNTTNGNSSWRDGKAYSYSAVVANIRETKVGRVFLLTYRTYSSTTNGHMSGIRRSIPISGYPGSDDWDKQVFTVPNLLEYSSDIPFAAHTANVGYMADQIAEDRAKAKKARKNGPYLLASAERGLQIIGFYLDAFELQDNAELLALFSDETLESRVADELRSIAETNAANLAARKERKRRDAEQKERNRLAREAAIALYTANIELWRSQPVDGRDDSLIVDIPQWNMQTNWIDNPEHSDVIQRQKEIQKDREEARRLENLAREARKQANWLGWLAGTYTGSRWDMSKPSLRDYLRINPNNQAEAETSQGVNVPLEHVQRVAPLVLALITKGRTYQRNGHTIRLGFYTLESIDAEGNVRVGCHVFDKEEIKRFAALIGSTPADSIEIPATDDNDND